MDIKMTDKRLTIICRYNEDISWTESLSGDVVIYNKGDDFPWDYPRTDVENFGRESESYVRGILEFYEKLSDYDSVAFLQGNPFHHSKKLFDKLDCNLENNFAYLGDYAQSVITNVETCIYGTSTHIVDIFWKDIVERTSSITEKNNFNDNNFTNLQYKVHLGDGKYENRVSELLEIIYFCEIMKIPYKKSEYIWDCGAQYIVKTDNILSKSKYWWMSLHNLLHYTTVKLNSNILGYILERTWPLIWNHDERRSITGHFYGDSPKI
jgi:hypothetical protein